jgi:hypothetical protein
MFHRPTRSCGVVRKRRPVPMNRPCSSARLTWCAARHAVSMPRRSSMVNSHQTAARKRRLPLPNENDPHQTFANRDPHASPRVVTRFLTGRGGPLLRQQAPRINVINRQGVASRSTRSSNDDERVPDPSILTPPAGQSGTFRAPPSLNVGQDLLRQPEPSQRLGQRQAHRSASGPLHYLRDHTNRE